MHSFLQLLDAKHLKHFYLIGCRNHQRDFNSNICHWLIIVDQVSEIFYFPPTIFIFLTISFEKLKEKNYPTVAAAAAVKFISKERNKKRDGDKKEALRMSRHFNRTHKHRHSFSTLRPWFASFFLFLFSASLLSLIAANDIA